MFRPKFSSLLTFKVQLNWNLMVEIIVHGSAHSGLIELAAAEMGSTKAGLVTKGQFNEKEEEEEEEEEVEEEEEEEEKEEEAGEEEEEAELGSTKGDLVTKGQFNEELNPFDQKRPCFREA